MTTTPNRKAEPMHHLHQLNHPGSLAILRALFAGRLDAAATIGYQRTPYGALVDWDSLEHSWLSTSETAAVIVARGLARIERHGGGFPARLAGPIRDAVTEVTGGQPLNVQPTGFDPQGTNS